MNRTVVVAVDWSPVSRRAAKLAAEIAHGLNAQFVLVHVRPSQSSPAPSPPRPGRDPKADLDALASEWAAEVRASGVGDVATIFLDGPPVDALLAYAEANPPDLLVFGRRGHTSGTRMLLGGVSSAVLQHAQCPILVVP